MWAVKLAGGEGEKCKRFKKKIWRVITKMAEMIKENQYRITLIIVIFVYILGILYLLFLINSGNRSFSDFIKFWGNWTLIGVTILAFNRVRPLIRQVWEQTEIRDDIERYTLLKGILENAKLMKEIGIDFDKRQLKDHIIKLTTKKAD